MTPTMLFTVPCLALVLWMLARSVWDVMQDDADETEPYEYDEDYAPHNF